MGAMIPVAIAKDRVIQAIGSGASVYSATKAVGRAEKTYEMWRRDDKEFAGAVDRARAARHAALAKGEDAPVPVSKNITFEDFRKTYLDRDTYRHQRAWISVLEGEDYQPIEGERFVAGTNRRRILINTPPFHAKSSTITVDYSVYRICMNPNVRIIIVSKTQAQAKKFLYAIKQRLTDRRWAKLQAAFAPDPQAGFKGEGEWSANKVYVGGTATDEKDPTVEALGIGGQIYGARADLIILDDVADVGNAHEFEKQIDWLAQDVDSRLFDGRLLVVGTRVGPQDIYSELMNHERYTSGRSPWTHLAQPAVLGFTDDPTTWTTLWPRSSQKLDSESDDIPDEDGTYEAWSGQRLAQVRDSKKAKTWALVYQQQDSAGDDAVFQQDCVLASVEGRRKAGPLTAGAWGHPRGGGEGMWTIASMDPSVGQHGENFTLVGKVDRTSQTRYIEQAWVQSGATPAYIRDLIKSTTETYGVNEWVIEDQGFQGFLVHDPELTQWLGSRGIRINGHYTGKNKLDPDYGVSSLAPLFGSTRRINDGNGRKVHNKDSLIELPDPGSSQGVKALIEELVLWVPGVRGSKLRQDGPMALWFFELRARQILGFGDNAMQTHMKVPFMNRRSQNKTAVRPLPLRGLSRVG